MEHNRNAVILQIRRLTFVCDIQECVKETKEWLKMLHDPREVSEDTVCEIRFSANGFDRYSCAERYFLQYTVLAGDVTTIHPGFGYEYLFRSGDYSTRGVTICQIDTDVCTMMIEKGWVNLQWLENAEVTVTCSLDYTRMHLKEKLWEINHVYRKQQGESELQPEEFILLPSFHEMHMQTLSQTEDTMCMCILDDVCPYKTYVNLLGITNRIVSIGDRNGSTCEADAMDYFSQEHNVGALDLVTYDDGTYALLLSNCYEVFYEDGSRERHSNVYNLECNEMDVWFELKPLEKKFRCSFDEKL